MIRVYRGVNIHPRNAHGMYWAIVDDVQVSADTVAGMRALIAHRLNAERDARRSYRFGRAEPLRDWQRVGTVRHDPETGEPVTDWATCGTCHRTWNDALTSDLTPAPSARCPFEYEHTERENTR